MLDNDACKFGHNYNECGHGLMCSSNEHCSNECKKLDECCNYPPLAPRLLELYVHAN